MAIDLMTLEPHVISRDLREKIVLLYGSPKVGKTTTASKFDKSLLVCFEKGYNALSGVYAQNINKWSEFKQVLKQLQKKEVQEKFFTIVIDTVDLAYDACEKFICQREGVDVIGDIPYGAGYRLARKEFEDALRLIPMLGFGLVMISHAQTSTFTDEEGKEFSKTIPTLAKQPRQVVLSMADIIGYAKAVERDGESKVALFLRGTPQFEAGSRFRYTPSVIPFEYESLVNAIAEAIKKEEEERGQAEIVTESNNIYAEEETPSFDELKEEIKTLTESLVKEKGQDETKKVLKNLVETYLGKGRSLKDVTESQIEQLILIAYDLKEELKRQ